MIPLLKFKTVPIANISVGDYWHLTPFLDLSTIPVPNTIRYTSGNLHPPIVKNFYKKAGNYVLICGRNRLKSITTNCPEQTHITVLILPEDLSDDETILYLISDKNVSGNFSDMEKAFLLRLCCESRSLKEVSQTILPLLGEKPQTHVADKLLSLTSLEPAVQQSIHRGRISSKFAYELLTLSPNDRITLHDLFMQLELGGGKQKRLYSLCKDISLRHHTDIATLLAADDYHTILNHAEMNIPQKGASLLNLLQKQLFPDSTEAENVFLKRVRNMKLPGNCTVEHSPAFEKDEISVNMQFKDIEQLEEQVLNIKEICS